MKDTNQGRVEKSETQMQRKEVEKETRRAIKNVYEEIPRFVPTLEELSVLYEHWDKVSLDLDWSHFILDRLDTSQIRTRHFAALRKTLLYQSAGSTMYDKEKEIRAWFRERQDQKLWQKFCAWKEYQGGHDWIGECWRLNTRSSAHPLSAVPSMILNSSAFANGESIPEQHSVDGENTSPPLQWSTSPEGTKSLALTMDDIDCTSVCNHWLMFNIPPHVQALKKGILRHRRLLNGAVQGTNSYGRIGYNGPHHTQPFHRYQFKIYSLDESRITDPSTCKSRLLDAMEGHILDEGALTVIYKG